MEPLIHSLTTTVAQDVRQLVHATQLEVPTLIEKDPPNSFRWRLPLGFVTVAAAGVLLIAAGGIQSQVQSRVQDHPKEGAGRHKTRLHKHKARPQTDPLRG